LDFFGKATSPFSVYTPPGGTSAPTLIASDQNAPWGIALDANNVYWTNYGDGAGTGSVMKAALDGGIPIVLAAGQNFPSGIAVDDTNVYWANFGDTPNDGALMTIRIDGTGLATIATGMQEPTAIAVDATSLYFTGQAGFSILTPK
jgi:DNA-binding beta-propeller fold protein YncE